MRSSLFGRHALMAAALAAAGNAGSPMVRKDGAPPPPKCDRCGHKMIKTHRAQNETEDFWVCGNGMCGVVPPSPPTTRAERRRAERERQKEAKRAKR